MVYDNKPGGGVNDIIIMDQIEHQGKLKLCVINLAQHKSHLYFIKNIGKGLMISTIFVTLRTGDTIKKYIE